MKSKEEIFNEQYNIFISGQPGLRYACADNVSEPERQAVYAMMDEYAATGTAERDEYRKALERILSLPDEQADGDGEVLEDPGQAIYDMQAVASATLAKYPQQ